MKSATETFESSMRRVVRVSKMQARGPGEKCRGFQEGWSLSLTCLSGALRSPEPDGGAGPPAGRLQRRPSGETGRASPRKGKKKREVKRLSGGGKNKIKIKWGSWGKWPSNLSMQPTDPFAVFPLFWLVSKNIPEGKRIELPSQAFENTSVWLSLQELLVCPERDSLYAFCWMSQTLASRGPSPRRCLVKHSSEPCRGTVWFLCFEVREETDPGRCRPGGPGRRMKSPCGGLSPDSSRAHPTDIFRSTRLPSIGLPNWPSPCPDFPELLG